MTKQLTLLYEELLKGHLGKHLSAAIKQGTCVKILFSDLVDTICLIGSIIAINM